MEDKNVFPSILDVNVLIEHTLRKLSTGEVDVTNGQASGKQKWDVSQKSASVSGGRACLHPNRDVPRKSWGQDGSLSLPQHFQHCFLAFCFPKYSHRGRQRGAMRPKMPCKHPVHLVGCSQLCLFEVKRGAQETHPETLIPGMVLPQLSLHWGSQAVTTF